jgi:hypothetical protein
MRCIAEQNRGHAKFYPIELLEIVGEEQEPEENESTQRPTRRTSVSSPSTQIVGLGILNS